jgi:hypothetical protein
MKPDSYTQYNEDPTVDALDGQEGVVEAVETFGLELSDDEIVKTLNERINDSRTFWNDRSSFNLKERRKRNARYVVGDHWYDVSGATDIPYVQNEIFTAEQVISAYVTGNLPEVEVLPATDTPESRRFAANIQSMLIHHAQEHGLQAILCNVVLSLLNDYIAVIELEWDPNCGEFGDIVPKYRDPKNIIADKRAKLGDNPGFWSFTNQNTAEELSAKFPKAADKIRNKVGDKMQSIITWRSVWVTVYIEGKPVEAYTAYFDEIVLAKHKSPNWIYDEEIEETTNYLTESKKPILSFNYINDGTHVIDRYGPIDQVIPLQLMIDRIGRQIQKGVAHSSPVLVFNKKALPKPAADQVKGSPWEKILVDAKDVRTAYGVIQADQVPAFVVNEINRLAASLHEIFGTPPQMRGDSNNNQTATQDLMARNQAQGRQDLLVRAIDRGLDSYFNYLLQMMKVYYTEDHFASMLGEDGRYNFVALNRSKIEDGVKVRIKPGSTVPMDKGRLSAVGLQLAEMGKISLLSLYEFLDVPNPGKHVERVLKEQIDPTVTIEDIRNDDQDANAAEDYDSIKAGQEVPPRDDPDTHHIKTHQQQLLSNDFMEWPVQNQEMFKAHIEAEIQKAKLLNGITDEELYPKPEDVSVKSSLKVPEAMKGEPPVEPPITPPSLPPQGEAPPVPDMANPSVPPIV